MIRRKIKIIQISADKCTGCRACELICAAFHADPKYAVINPKRSRIRVFCDEGNDIYVPVIAGHHAEVECNSRTFLNINGKSYGECAFCRSACPSRDLFREPDKPDIPLKCDVCGEPMPEDGPLCVQWCQSDALMFAEREEDIACKPDEMDDEITEL